MVLDLVRWADVVTESFTPGVMRGWGLDYEALRAVKPDVIMLSTCLMGQTGPLRDVRRLRQPGRRDHRLLRAERLARPCARRAVRRVHRLRLAALLARRRSWPRSSTARRTGEGQYIDLAQAEASLHFLAPAILDYDVNGRASTRSATAIAMRRRTASIRPPATIAGWRSPSRDDVEWRGLCAAMNRPDLGADPRFATPAARHAAADALDAAVTSWTRRPRCHRDRGVAAAARRPRPARSRPARTCATIRNCGIGGTSSP